MAVIYATFIKSAGAAKANIRYIQHRRGKDDQRITRELFGYDGVVKREEAYNMIDEAEKDTHFYRISLNPDPVSEDSKNDLDLKELTRETMRTLEKRLGKPIEFVASVHKDQRRHVHLLALIPQNIKKAQRGNLKLASSYNSIRIIPASIVKVTLGHCKRESN